MPGACPVSIYVLTVLQETKPFTWFVLWGRGNRPDQVKPIPTQTCGRKRVIFEVMVDF